MAAPTVIKWSDAGSPALTRTASSLINVLDYCLPQRGWVKEFSGTDKAVYRAGSGERKFYRVLNDGSFYFSSITYQYCHARITAYDSMTDVDTGAGQWGEGYITVSNSGTAVPRPWVCIVNETAVIFLVLPHLTAEAPTANGLVFGFGDTIPALPGNTARAFLAAGLLNSPLNNSCPVTCPLDNNTSPYANPLKCSRSLDGSRTALSVGLAVNGGNPGTANGTTYPFGVVDTTALSYPYNGELLCGRPMLNDGIAYSMGDYIPGIFYPCQKGNCFDNWGQYQSGDLLFLAARVVSCTSHQLTITLTAYTGALLVSLSGDHWS